jgi:repressor LexA
MRNVVTGCLCTTQLREIVVAMSEDDEATIKRFFKETSYFRLQPENSSMEPIIVDQVTILDKVVGVYRHIQ